MQAQPRQRRRDLPEYISWAGMKQRVLNPRHEAFPSYGARGIAICESWLSFENFAAFLGLSAAAVAGLGIMAIGAAFGVLLNPITLLAGGLAYLSYKLYQNREAFENWKSILLGGGALLGVSILAARFGVLGTAIMGTVRGIAAMSGLLMANPWVAAIAGLVAIGFAIYNHWDEIIAYCQSLPGKIAGFFQALPAMIGGALRGLAEEIIQPFKVAEAWLRQSWIGRQIFGEAPLPETLGRYGMGARGAALAVPRLALPASPADLPFADFLRRRNEGLTLTEKYGTGGSGKDGAARVEDNRTITQNITNNIVQNIQQPTAAPGLLAAAVGSSLGVKLRSMMADQIQ